MAKINVFKMSLSEDFSNGTNYAISIEDCLDIISKDLEEIAQRTKRISKIKFSNYSIEYKIPKERLHNYYCDNLDENEIKILDKYLDKLKVF